MKVQEATMTDVFDLPEDHILRAAHRASIYHRHAIERAVGAGASIA